MSLGTANTAPMGRLHRLAIVIIIWYLNGSYSVLTGSQGRDLNPCGGTIGHLTLSLILPPTHSGHSICNDRGKAAVTTATTTPQFGHRRIYGRLSLHRTALWIYGRLSLHKTALWIYGRLSLQDGPLDPCFGSLEI